MADAIETRETELLNELATVREQISSLTDRLSVVDDVHAIDTGVEDSRHSGSQRLTLLYRREEELLKQLAQLPFQDCYPLASLTDVLGSDLSETVTELS
jgi:hypothetical protein